MAPVNAARRTIGCWLLAAFLERGCEPAKRLPRRVVSVRPLTPREMAELNPLAASLVPLTNLRWLPFPRVSRRGICEV
jgi:hypothetical protein